MSAIDDIAAERRRQIEAEGWTPEHDDEHANDEMAMAAVCYADPNPPLVPDPLGEVRGFPAGWPWDYRWWKPKDRRRNLVRAAALLAAEIDRYDRLLRRLVSEALQNAAANGVDFVGWTDEAIATDMLTYDADLEDADHAAVTALVRELRNGSRRMTTRQSMGDIFLGVTPKAIRDYMQLVFEAARNEGYKKVVIPCAGRFTVPEAAIGAGWAPQDVLTSDISMFSSVVGYHMAGRPFADLGISFHDEFDSLQDWLAGPKASAAVLVALKIAQLRADKYFERIVRDDVVKRFSDYVDQIDEQLQGMRSVLGGVRYEIADINAVLDQHKDDPSAVLFVNPPSFSKGYSKMFDTKGRIVWTDPQIPEFDSKTGRNGLYSKLMPAEALTFFFRGRVMDEGLEDKAVFAAEGNKRIDYVLANRPDEVRAIVKRRPETKIASARIPFLPDDYEITPDCVISYREVTKGQALYYRDLFAHKLGVTRAERYFVALLDGYLMAVFGMFFSEVQRGMSGKVYEVFGFCCPSPRYPRLNRLFMTSIVCDDARKSFQAACSGALRDVDYFQTTCISTTPEQKVHRGSLKLMSREVMDDGRFKLVYGGAFKPWDFRKVIENWMGRMRNIERETGKPMGIDLMPDPATSIAEANAEAA